MGMVRVVAVAGIFAVAAGMVRGQLEVRFFQVGDLVSERVFPPLGTGFPVTEAMAADERPSFGKISKDEPVEVPGIDSNFLEALLSSIAESLDPDGRIPGGGFSLSGGVLRVIHGSQVLDALEGALAGVRGHLRRGIRIELLQVGAADAAGLSPGALSREAVDRLRPGSLVLGSTDAHHMIPVRVQAGSSVAYMGDYNVEVAGESRIGEPRVFQLRDGVVAGVEAGVLASGKVAIHGRCRIARLQEMRVRDTEATWLGRLQLPVVDFLSAAGAGIVESGGGILMGVKGGEGEAMILMIATVDGRQVRSGDGTGLIASAALGLRKRALPSLAGPDGAEPEESFYIEPYQFTEALPFLVPSEDWESDGMFSWTDRGFVAVRGRAGFGERVREALGCLEAAALKPAGLELRYGLAPAGGLSGLSAPGADLARLAGSLDGRMLLSSIGGEDFEVAAGREQALIQGYDVEIAQKSSIADPYVAPVFDGVVFRGNLQVSGDRSARLTGEFLVADSVQEPVAFDPKCTDVGVVELARQRRALAILSSELEADRWTVVHAAGVPGQDRGFVILARLRL